MGAGVTLGGFLAGTSHHIQLPSRGFTLDAHVCILALGKLAVRATR